MAHGDLDVLAFAHDSVATRRPVPIQRVDDSLVGASVGLRAHDEHRRRLALGDRVHGGPCLLQVEWRVACRRDHEVGGRDGRLQQASLWGASTTVSPSAGCLAARCKVLRFAGRTSTLPRVSPLSSAMSLHRLALDRGLRPGSRPWSRDACKSMRWRGTRRWWS